MSLHFSNLRRSLFPGALVLSLSALAHSGVTRSNLPMSGLVDQDRVTAPDFPKGLDWLNTAQPLSLKQLRGKVVLLDFWTYCCINCMHIIPDLERLEKKYADELVVIGVHSAKFTTEQGTRNIREAILRYGITHPVVNDKDFAIWNAYGVNAWPTLVLIDPGGKVVGKHSGEGIYRVFDDAIGKLVTEWDARGKLDHTRLRFALEKDKAAKSFFSFPGKLAVDARGRRLFISDSDNNRIVVLSLPGDSVLETIGSGGRGLKDGSFQEAEFNHPQGIAAGDDVLYVADTENHAIRKVDLRAKSVVTLAGTGQQAREPNVAGVGRAVALNSPWDLLVHDGKLYIAMAGPHQIWTLDLQSLEAAPFAGSGAEGLQDGKLLAAALAQPSGITTDGTTLYWDDSEASAVRSADFSPSGEVRTIVGEGLFDFGDIDGVGPKVRLQHPIGITFSGEFLYVADTYNNKIKRINPRTRRSETLIGTGKVGARDGPALEAELNEPNGLVVANGRMYIADTDNHLIRIYGFADGQVHTLIVKEAERLLPRASGHVEFAGKAVALDARRVRPGKGVIRLEIPLPGAYKWNTMAPFYVGAFSSDRSVVEIPDSLRERNLEAPSFPLEIPAFFRKGEATLTLNLVLYYCEAKSENLCLVKELKVTAPATVTPEADGHVFPVRVELRP